MSARPAASSGERPDAAWLVFGELKANRRSDKRGWVNRQPIGVQVVDEVLRRAGLKVGVCSPAAVTAPVVLVSLTSEHDVMQLYAQVALHPHWQRGARKFRVVAGGYGMQNPWPIREYVDYAYFGRAEGHAAALVADALAGRPSSDPSVMHLAEPHPVQVRQAEALYRGQAFEEQFTGCPLKCKFCHFTFARKHQGADHAYSRKTGTAGSYVQGGGHGVVKQSLSLEVTWPQLMEWPHGEFYHRVVVGLDGPSERLRFLYGKRISDGEVGQGPSRYFAGAHAAGLVSAWLHVYDIGGFPGERQSDREHLAKALRSVEVPDGFKGLVRVHITPFKASAWTPMQWEPFAMDDWRRRYNGAYITRFKGSKAIRREGKGSSWSAAAFYSNTIEGPGSQIVSALVARHDGSEEYRRAFHAVALSPAWRKAKSAQRMKLFRAEFPGVFVHALGAHEVGAPLPSQLARPVVEHDKLAAIARKMRSDVERSGRSKSWRRGQRSIMGTPLA